jgi:predicted ATP-grasp superfamily ATP-dependent carboligase
MTGFSKPSSGGPGPQQVPPVIVLGVDTPIGVAILRDLGRHGYTTIGIGRSNKSIGFASRFCHQGIIRAAPESGLITQLQELARKFPNAALIAISENDNLLINRHRSQLERDLRVLAPTQEMLEQVLDKSRCLKLAQQVGIRIPDTFTPQTLEEIEQRAEKLTYPRVIKWADPNEVGPKLEKLGLTALKCQYAHNASDLIEKLRPYDAIHQFPLIQEYCPGQGIGQMFLVRDGEITLQFQHQRIHEWPPEGGVSTLCKSLPKDAHGTCLKRSVALLQALQWNGVAMVEYRYDSDTDVYYFMEVNGRFWGSLPLAIAAGVPFAAALVDSDNKRTSETEQPAYPDLYCRFMIPEVRRLARLLFQPAAIQDPYYRYSRWQELKEFVLYFFRSGTRYYLFSLSDPGPFLADLKNVAFKTLLRRS